MTKPNFSSQLKYYLLTHKKKPPEGFSLIEIMVAMTILSIAFAVNLQFLLLLQIQNLEQKMTVGAVSLSREILEGSRARWLTSVNPIPTFKETSTTQLSLNNPGTTTFTLSDDRKKDFGGYKYNVIVNICSNDDPTITDDVISNCASDVSSELRTVIVQVKHPKLSKFEYDETTKQTKTITAEKVIHTDRATFTPLTKKPK